MQNRHSTFLAALLLIAAAPPPVATAQAGSIAGSSAGAEEVMSADKKFNQAVATRDRALFASMIAEDATFMGGALIHGRKAIVEAWEVFLSEDRATVLSWEPHSVEIAASGDLAYTLGVFELRTRHEDGTEEVATGSYVSIWKKHDDGSWKVVADAGTPPAPATIVQLD